MERTTTNGSEHSHPLVLACPQRGDVTVSLLDGDWTAPLGDRALAELRLKNVKLT